MIDDELKKILAMRSAAEDAAKLYRLPAAAEILRSTGFDAAHHHLDAIGAVAASEKVSLSQLLPVTVADSLKTAMQSFAEDAATQYQMPAVSEILRSTGFDAAHHHLDGIGAVAASEKVSLSQFLPFTVADNLKTMQSTAHLAELYRMPADEILRSTDNERDWQRQFDAIGALAASEQLNLRHLLLFTAADDLSRLQSALQPPNAIAEMIRGIEKDALRNESSLRELMGGVLSPAVLSGYSSLNTMMHDVGLQATAISSLERVKSATSLLAPVEQYGRFLQDTIGHIATVGVDPLMSRALQGSILLTDDILGANAEVTARLTPSAGESRFASMISPVSLALPFVQRDELVAARKDLPSLNVVDLALYSPAHSVAQRANRILQAVFDVNTERKLKQKQETFSATNRMMIAVRDLPLLVVTNQSSFGDFLDTLYFLFFESAGDDHLRYLDSKGGELTDEECEIVWIIKHLRNYGRHDLDHGKDVRKKWRDLDADLKTLGFNTLPRTRQEFRRMQTRILEMTEEFVTLLCKRIS
jgi:hypothetical protein